MDRKDFNKWLIGKPEWKEIAYQYYTGNAFQGKQDLVAIFWNGYIYFQQKFETYYKEFNIIPYDVFEDLIFEFRQNFPKQGRIEGINYFDDLIELLIEKHSTRKPPKQQKKTSYEWQNKPDKELPELYSLMINKYKLIVSETTYEQFKAVFTGQPIDGSFEPIKWHNDNASELLYFIDRLEQSNNIKHNSKRADYQKLKACFVKPDGKQFNAVWKSLKTNIETNLSPDKQKAIDELVSNF